MAWKLAGESEKVFKIISDWPWLRDGLSPDEVTVVENSIRLSGKSRSRSNEAAALRINDILFLRALTVSMHQQTASNVPG